MKKLKIILQCNWIFYIVFSIALCYCFICNSIPRNSVYDKHETYFEGTITDIFIDGNYLSMKIKAKEKLQCIYFFTSLKEKEEFINSYELGDSIKIEGYLTTPNNNTNPNLFNYRKYLYNEKIYYILNIEKYVKLKDNKNIIYYIKNNILERINVDTKTGAYLSTLILGDNRYMDDHILNIYQSLGVSHLFAISGMHVGLLSTLLLFILKRMHWSEKLSYVIIISFLIIYLLLIGGSPSAIRAVILFVLLAMNRLWKWNISTFNVFLFAISLIIISEPSIVLKIGFQFSSLISGVLILNNSLINSYKTYLTKLIMISFISFLVGIPICIYNFYQINVLSIIYNLFFVPFMSFLLFPLTLLTFIFPFLNKMLLAFINIIENIANMCSSIPSVLFFKKPSLFIVAIYFIIIFYILKKWQKSKKLLFLFILVLGIHYNYNSIFLSDYVIMLDVGQGDSILLHSKDKNILIDTGGSIEYSVDSWKKRKHTKNISDNTVIPLLKSLGISKLDYLILTHGDADHMGESINLVNNFKTDKVIFNCGPYNDLEQELIKVLDKKKIKYYSCIKELNIDNNKLYFLNNKIYDNENDNSNVIYTELNNYKFLFMGDAGVTTENEILSKYNLPDIDVLKLGHHGSKTSSSKEFIDEINPKYSVISVGKNNRYGHPNKEVLNNLNNSKIYRTDQDGSIMFKIKNNKLKIKTCSP